MMQNKQYLMMNGNGEFDCSELSEKSVSGKAVSDRAVPPNPELQIDYTEELGLRIHHYLVNLREERMTDQQSLRQDMHVQFELNRTAFQLAADYSTDFEPSDVQSWLEPLFRSFSDLWYFAKIAVVGSLFSVEVFV